MATLNDLSQRTGYAPATISRILNGDPTLSVTAEARRAVLEEAGRLNYSQTRSRRGRTPKTVLRIGMAEALTPAQQLDDPYYLYLSNHVRQGCIDRKYACVPLESRGDGFVGPEFKYDDRRQSAPEIRRQMFVRWMEERGWLDRSLLLDCPMEVEATAAAWQAHLRAGRELPTAVLCASVNLDMLACAAPNGRNEIRICS